MIHPRRRGAGPRRRPGKRAFPTGPLDIIQAWLQVTVKDDQGKVIFERGAVDDKGFIQPGTFMFKAEPVDKYGNLILTSSESRC